MSKSSLKATKPYYQPRLTNIYSQYLNGLWDELWFDIGCMDYYLPWGHLERATQLQILTEKKVIIQGI